VVVVAVDRVRWGLATPLLLSTSMYHCAELIVRSRQVECQVLFRLNGNGKWGRKRAQFEQRGGEGEPKDLKLLIPTASGYGFICCIFTSLCGKCPPMTKARVGMHPFPVRGGRLRVPLLCAVDLFIYLFSPSITGRRSDRLNRVEIWREDP